MALGVAFLVEFLFAVLTVLPAVAILVVLELALPRGDQPTTLQRTRGLLFKVISIAATTLFAVGFAQGWSAIGGHPLITLQLPQMPGPARFAIATLIGWMFADFGFYVGHRLQHRFAWRFHAVHHSVGRLGAANSYDHWTQELFQLAFATVPLTILVGVPSTAAATAIFAAHTTYIHSSTALNFGWFRRVLVDNSYHRVHHSREPKHFDKNFGVCFPIWDVVFRTAYFPAKNEWPETGLVEAGEVHGIWDYLWRPFQPSLRAALGEGVERAPGVGASSPPDEKAILGRRQVVGVRGGRD